MFLKQAKKTYKKNYIYISGVFSELHKGIIQLLWQISPETSDYAIILIFEE